MGPMIKSSSGRPMTSSGTDSARSMQVGKMGKTLRNVPTQTPVLEPGVSDSVMGRGDPQQRYRVYRLCLCPKCKGTGKARVTRTSAPGARCVECRGEGRKLDLVACCADPQGLGVTLVTLAEEGEFDDCPVGILIDGGSWLIKPWLPSPRNVADAAKVLARSKTKGE